MPYYSTGRYVVDPVAGPLVCGAGQPMVLWCKVQKLEKLFALSDRCRAIFLETGVAEYRLLVLSLLQPQLLLSRAQVGATCSCFEVSLGFVCLAP